ncbi:formate dehydrogenase accessory sulfurtransferase FdhD [Staphylococcus epidermidis]|uniref:formate dehydrogenase accessory sulfurtransferase FdhD n=1 Tax=Staphylococcus epidermidis TaxID=1282 RepID=UPI0011A33B71|nr:formate dehydrogenase accessory sulfurtransferase FdhD [Staphylococcus epidermidis]
MGLRIKVKDIEFGSIICSGKDLEELSLGFVGCEGILLKRNDLEWIDIEESKGLGDVKVSE